MDFIHNIFGTNLQAALFIVLNLILIESLLSIDNAAVLATMVLDLPAEQRSKALKYGIFGAYFFRGVCLIFASILVKILWLKALGGLYLCWLAFAFFKHQFWGKGTQKVIERKDIEEANQKKRDSPFYKMTLGFIGPFWSTVVLVEIMDLAFSIDNVFAAVAFTNNIWLICLGVFIGILAMRFAAQVFVYLLGEFPFLESAAYSVIALLGIRLVNSYTCDLFANSQHPVFKQACLILNGHNSDFITSLLTISIFAIPLLSSMLFNYPRRAKLINSAQEIKP